MFVAQLRLELKFIHWIPQLVLYKEHLFKFRLMKKWKTWMEPSEQQSAVTMCATRGRTVTASGESKQISTEGKMNFF